MIDFKTKDDRIAPISYFKKLKLGGIDVKTIHA